VPQTAEQDRPLTPGEVAAIFGVSTVTVAAWADQGRLPHFRTPGGQRRFRREDVDAFLAATGGAA
jgi:excisionase family DNA binding protein